MEIDSEQPPILMTFEIGFQEFNNKFQILKRLPEVYNICIYNKRIRI